MINNSSAAVNWIAGFRGARVCNCQVQPLQYVLTVFFVLAVNIFWDNVNSGSCITVPTKTPWNGILKLSLWYKVSKKTAWNYNQQTDASMFTNYACYSTPWLALINNVIIDRRAKLINSCMQPELQWVNVWKLWELGRFLQ